jgi:hypothetical protein
MLEFNCGQDTPSNQSRRAEQIKVRHGRGRYSSVDLAANRTTLLVSLTWHTWKPVSNACSSSIHMVLVWEWRRRGGGARHGQVWRGREKAVEAMARRLLSFLWTDSALLQRRAGVMSFSYEDVSCQRARCPRRLPGCCAFPAVESAHINSQRSREAVDSETLSCISAPLN